MLRHLIARQGHGGTESVFVKSRPAAQRVVFLVRSLDIGGAERQLVAMAVGLYRRGVEVAVVTFYPGGVLRRELEEAGVPVSDLGKQGRWDVVAFAFRLVKALRREHPTVIYSLLPVANILSALTQPFLSRARIVWGVRASNMDLSRYDWLSRLAMQVEGRLARPVDRIVCNSEAGRLHHARLGYPAGRMLVIRNGIDSDRFRFDPAGRKHVRAEWGVAPHEILIGLVARLDPMKDHPTFLKAAALLANNRTDVRFVCVGEGPSHYRRELHNQTVQLGIADRVIWSGVRTDMPAIYSALDIAASSSFGEGFCNAIAEAMACQRPCIVTDVGDSARMVAETGRAVTAHDPGALADAFADFANMCLEKRLALGFAARVRVQAEFGAEKMIQRTGEVLGLW